MTYDGSYVSNKETFSYLACKNIKSFSCFNGGVNAYGAMNMVLRSQLDNRIANRHVLVFVVIADDFLRGIKNSKTAHFILREPSRVLSGLWRS